MKSNQGPPAGGPFFFGQNHHASPEHDTLLELLARVRRRLRLARVVRELSFAACWLCAALLVHRLLQAFVSSTPVVESLTALSIVVSFIAAAIHVGRALPSYSLARTAGVIDSRAELADELKTAHWLLAQKAGAPMARIQVERARATGRQLDSAQVAPISVPASAAVAAMFLFASAMLPPAPAQSDSHASAQVTDASSQSSGPVKSPVQTRPRPSLDQEWVELEQAVRYMGDYPESEALTSAIRSRDAGLVAELLKQLQSGRAGPAAQPATRAASDAPEVGEDHGAAITMPPDEADRMRPTPKALIEAKGAEVARVVALAQALSEQTQMASSPTSEQPPSSAGPGPSGDGAMPLDGQRDGVPPDADTLGASGDAPANAKSTAGEEGVSGGEGSDARGTARARLDEEVKSLPLLGERTMRLRTQLERVRIEAAAQPDSAGIRDRVYAPTSEQVSGLAYEAVTPRARYATAAAVAGEDVPLIYREVVKDYFLKLNQEED